MKITDVEALIIKQPSIAMIGDGTQDTVLIKVHTDEGITGIGEVDSSPYVVKAIIETPASHMVCMGLKEAILGEDPFDIEKIWNKMYHRSYYYGRRSVAIHAMSGIDMAIWDIIGKAVGKPVHKLIGGAYRDKIPAYCSVLMPDNEDEIKRIADTYLPMGFKAVKFGWGAIGQSKENDIRLVMAARKALGPDVNLMIDVGMVWKDAKTAIQICKALEEFDVYWIEEPLSPDNFEGYKQLVKATNLKISAGEEFGTLYEYKELIDGCRIDVVQPDMSRCGGITIGRKIVDMAMFRQIPVIPHNFKTGVLMSASLQLLAAMPDAMYLEYCCQETVLSKHLIKNHFAIDSEGNVAIPQGAGLGVEVDEKVVEKYSVKIA